MCRCTLKLLRIVPIIVFTLSHSYQSTAFLQTFNYRFQRFCFGMLFQCEGKLVFELRDT